VPFVFDDQDNIQNNQYIRITELNLAGLYDAAFKSLHSARPLANVSFALNYYSGGYDVTGYHLTNIIIHVINGILVYFITLFTFKQILKIKNITLKGDLEISISLIAFFSACLFVVHPVQVQSVTYIVQRMNSMASLFYFLSLLLFIIGRNIEVKTKRVLFWLGCLCSWMLALCCKQTAATLPLIIFLYEWYFYQDLNKGWLRKNAKYFIGIVLLLSLLSLVYLGGDPFARIMADYKFREFTLGERLLTELRVIVYYIYLYILPLPENLNLLPEFPLSRSLFNPMTTVLSLLGLFGLITTAVYSAKRYRLISLCIAWIFINLAIESSFIGLEISFEHRLYLPLFGFCMLTSYFIFQKSSERLVLYSSFTLIIVILLGVGTYNRNKDWQDVVTLWTDVASKSPHSDRAQFNLGKALQNKGLLDDAIISYQKVLSINTLHVGAHNNLGIILVDKGLYADAIEHFNKAIQINPLNADVHTNIGVALENLSQRNEAVKYYLEALKINKNHSKAHYLIGSAYQEQGKSEQARLHYSKTLELEFNQPMAHNNLGVILIEEGDINGAISHFSAAFDMNPEFALALFNLAYAQRIQGYLEEACHNYRKGFKLRPDFQKVKEDIIRYCETD
jgi:tetratricopeptide (TPR) repeat protein